MLGRLGLADRRRDRVETLSGGLRRRVELAKGMLHRPRLLLLDEPSTGLDPGARSDLWDYLQEVRREDGVTIVLTTHLLEEAEKADRIAILSEGALVALDTPEALKATVGGDSITIRTGEPDALASAINGRFGLSAGVVAGAVRFEQPEGHQWIARLVEAFPGRIDGVALGKPTLEDVFIDRTGHRFWHEREEASLARCSCGRPDRRTGRHAQTVERQSDRSARRSLAGGLDAVPARMGPLRPPARIACSARSGNRSCFGCCSGPVSDRRFGCRATRRA